MYTIKEASARSGVGAPLIRAWERRYGVRHPVRTPAGYRLYDDAAIRVLVAMRSLRGDRLDGLGGGASDRAPARSRSTISTPVPPGRSRPSIGGPPSSGPGTAST